MHVSWMRILPSHLDEDRTALSHVMPQQNPSSGRPKIFLEKLEQQKTCKVHSWQDGRKAFEIQL